MIMPYGRRPTQVEPSSNAPGEIDFNALWDRAFAPTIQSLGYDAVRADQDTGALIINQMIERLYFADLVLADMTIPNGNVYYEVGVRQAAKRTGCVLLAADWSKQLFDIAQLRTVRYPLSDGEVGEPAAKAVISAIQRRLKSAGTAFRLCMSSIKGYPGNADEAVGVDHEGRDDRGLGVPRGNSRRARSASSIAHGPHERPCRRILEAAVHPFDCARALAAHEGQRGERGRLELDRRLHQQAPRRRCGTGGGSRTECVRACQRRQTH